MQREDIAREVATVLADFVDDAEDISASAELGMDSFSRLCVLAELEGVLDVVLPEESIQDVDSVEQLVGLFHAALAAQSPQMSARLTAALPQSNEPALAAAGGR